MSDPTASRTVNDVLIVTSNPIAPGELKLHADLGERVLVRSLETVRQEWTLITGQVLAMLGETVAQTKSRPFGLDEVSVGLTFSATGKLAFIAEAGAEASITLTFKRREGNEPTG